MRRISFRLAAIALVAGTLSACGTGTRTGTVASPAASPVAEAADAADKAATLFAALAAPAATTGMPPRLNDPEAAKLLTTALDTGVVQRTPLAIADLKPIGTWLVAVSKVLNVYANAGTKTNATTAGKTNGGDQVFFYFQAERNTARFGPEIGMAFDGANHLIKAELSLFKEALAKNPKAFSTPEGIQTMARIHAGLALELTAQINALHEPGLNDSWRRERLGPLLDLGPDVAAFVPAGTALLLHHVASDTARCQRTPDIRADLDRLAATFPERAAGVLPATDAASAAHGRLVEASCAARQAAFQLEALATASGPSNLMPHQTDRAARPLLDAVLNTSAIPAEPGVEDLQPLAIWELSVLRIYLGYLFADAANADIGTLAAAANEPQVDARIGRNVLQFAPEFGRAADTMLNLMKPMAEELVLQARVEAGAPLNDQQTKRVEQFQHGLGQTMAAVLKLTMMPSFDEAWRKQRLTVLEALAPKAASVLTPADAAAIRTFASDHAKTERNAEIRARLTRIAAAFPA
jgi:hypothetical protein